MESKFLVLCSPAFVSPLGYCGENFADCVTVKFEFLNCDLCCFISTTTMSPLHCI